MVTVSFRFPPEIARNLTIQRHLWNVAYFVRDLWLARAPYASGSYARGLLQAGSIRVQQGAISIINHARHAHWFENGHGAFNIGLIMLANGRGVKVGKDGNRTKLIKIDPTPQTRHRADSVASSVMGAYRRVAPLGMKLPVITRYGQADPYKPRRALQRPLKPGKQRQGPQGFFVISERAIRQDPSKWRVPAMEGRKLGEQVQREAKPFVVEAVRQIVLAERARQQRVRGQNPSWYKPGMRRTVLKMVPMEKKR